MALQPPIDGDRSRPRQLLVDVSIIASHDAGTGIQRVVRSLLAHLTDAPPPGFEIRLVRATRRQQYSYADGYLTSPPDPSSSSSGEDICVTNGDIFLGLDLASRIAPRRQLDLLRWRTKGVRCAFVVYDLLPMLHPQWFTPRAHRSFRHWLSTLAVHADALLCISSSVSVETLGHMKRHFGLIEAEFATGWFHLGANLPRSGLVPRSRFPLPDCVRAGASRRRILMVGTIEPRKGHAQILDAFDLLWTAGVDGTLVIAGRQGWHVESLIERLRSHSEFGKRLFWLPSIDDDQLTLLYAELDGLVMASQAEGFGLPLVEAAQYGMPLLARDLAVFREVAGEHAVYFKARSAAELAPQLAAWLEQLDSGTATPSSGMKSLTWSESADQLRKLIVDLDRPR